MAKNSNLYNNHEFNFLHMELSEEDFCTTNDPQKQQPSKDQENNKDPDEEQECEKCHGKFTYRNFKEHKASKAHKLAVKNQRESRKQTPAQIVALTSPILKLKVAREKYYYRDGVDILSQAEHFQNVLTTFLSVRLSLNNDYKDLQISINNTTWDVFGDIVIETFDQENHHEIHAIQCKQIQNRNDISMTAVGGEKGKFSLKKQLEVLTKVQKRLNYENAYFKLFTVSKLKVDDNVGFIYDEDKVSVWQCNKKTKSQWLDKKMIVALMKKNNVINTTDDPDDICIFKLMNENGLCEEYEEKLSKFCLLKNQKKTLALKHLTRMLIEDKFGDKRDITEELVKYFSEYFEMDVHIKSNYKMTKRDVVLKIAELLLTPYVLLPEDTSEGCEIKLWNNTLDRFDIVIIQNQPDLLNRIYKPINFILKSKINNLKNFMKSFKIEKENILDDNLKSEIFDSIGGDSRNVSLYDLYRILWKVELIPLVLTVNNEDQFSLIMKIVKFLHSEHLPLKFIIATNKKIHPSHLPENLKIFTNMEDLRRVDPEFFQEVLNDVTVPFLNFSVKLKDIIDYNSDFSSKVTPDVLINMAFNDYSFSKKVVPLEGNIIDNTFVFSDEVISKIKNYIKGTTNANKQNLVYVVNMNGGPIDVEIAPDIFNC